MIRSSTIQAVLETLPDVSYVTPRIAVGIPPSDADSIWDEMRVAVDEKIVLRAFDPGTPVATGGPIAYGTKTGEPYVTKTDDPYVMKVEP